MSVHAHSVVGFFGIPELQLDHHVDLLVELYCADTEQLARVDDSDTAQLKEVADIIRGASHQGDVGRLLDLHGVVCNESVTALYKLDGGLALTYAAFAEDKHALAVDLNENSVARDTRRQLEVQEVDQLGGEHGGGFLGAQQGHFVGFRALQQLGEDLEVPCHHQCREFVAEQVVDTAAAHLRLQGVEVSPLGLSEHLNALLVEVFVKSGELKSRTVYLMVGNKCVLAVLGHVDHFELLLVDDLLEGE